MIAQARVFLILSALSALLATGLGLVGFPAALLLGPMLAAIVVSTRGHSIALHARLPVIAQAIIGQLMAHGLTAQVLREIGAHWAIFLGGVLSVVFISFSLGLLLTRLRVMPGTTALWGASPGAATAMLLLCEDYGADQRLVAFMVYLRVLMVTIATSVVAHFALVGAGQARHVSGALPVSPFAFWPCLPLIACAVLLAPFIRSGAAPLLTSMIGGVVLQAGFSVHYSLPFWLLAPSYVVIGWMIGRRFTRDVLHHVRRALPAVALSTTVLIAGCALLSWPLAHIAHVDPLSAYLATSPGGADSIAIIAASVPIDVPFVMAMQIARFLVLLAIAPAIATRLARLAPDGHGARSSQGRRNTDSA